MNRISLRSRDQLDEVGRAVFDEIMKSRGKVDEAFQVLLPTPELLRRIAHLGTYVRFGSGLSAAVRECIILATARHMNSEFEWNDHRPQALAAGVAEETIESIWRGELPATPKSSADERMVVQFVYETLRDKNVTDATFDAVAKRFGQAVTAEIAATIGFYSMLANILTVFNVGR
jgi:4-carboxymuconolactone decarboxylase